MRAIAGTLQRSRPQRDEKAIVTATPAGHWRLVHRHADYAQPDPRNKP